MLATSAVAGAAAAGGQEPAAPRAMWAVEAMAAAAAAAAAAAIEGRRARISSRRRATSSRRASWLPDSAGKHSRAHCSAIAVVSQTGMEQQLSPLLRSSTGAADGRGGTG